MKESPPDAAALTLEAWLAGAKVPDTRPARAGPPCSGLAVVKASRFKGHSILDASEGPPDSLQTGPPECVTVLALEHMDQLRVWLP